MSSYSNPDGATCVEVASAPEIIRVRDSKHIQVPRLAFAPRQCATFLPYASGRR